MKVEEEVEEIEIQPVTETVEESEPILETVPGSWAKPIKMSLTNYLITIKFNEENEKCLFSDVYFGRSFLDIDMS